MNMISRHEQKNLVNELLAIPMRIRELQGAVDMIDAEYESMLANLTWRAWTQPLFPGKKDGDAARPAGNDDERKLAVQMLIAQDAEFRRVGSIRDDAHGRLAYERNKLDAAKIITRLIGEPQQ